MIAQGLALSHALCRSTLLGDGRATAACHNLNEGIDASSARFTGLKRRKARRG